MPLSIETAALYLSLLGTAVLTIPIAGSTSVMSIAGIACHAAVNSGECYFSFKNTGFVSVLLALYLSTTVCRKTKPSMIRRPSKLRALHS